MARDAGIDVGYCDWAVETLELSALAKHAYVLAQTFNSFYHRYPVAQEEDEAVRHVRAALVHIYHEGMVDLLGLMAKLKPEFDKRNVILYGNAKTNAAWTDLRELDTSADVCTGHSCTSGNRNQNIYFARIPVN